MKQSHLPACLATTGVLAGVLVAAAFSAVPSNSVGALPNDTTQTTVATALQPLTDPSGVVQTLSASGPLDGQNPFFASLGTNGRSCVTCHQPTEGWSVRPDRLQYRFAKTGGLDPIFRLVDGANSPLAPTSTVAQRQTAYSMLLTRGVIRVGMPIPANAEFTLDAVDDPYGYASALELSLFRRPLPATNLPFLTTVMWDGRESPAGRSLTDNLLSQATDATLGHAQAAVAPTPEQVQQIVAMETSLYTAQIFDNQVGVLPVAGVLSGPLNLSVQPFYLGINDALGADPNNIPFDPNAMSVYHPWLAEPSYSYRQSVARGEALFNTKPISVTGVAGLNDTLHTPVINATCTTCHDTPNVGNHSLPLPINIGIADASRRTPDMPLYTLRNNVTGDTVQTTDPGRALVTGKWVDIGKFKGPILRGLASRAPYFHNGSAADLDAVIEFYKQRFNVPFTPQEKKDIITFLRTL